MNDISKFFEEWEKVKSSWREEGISLVAKEEDLETWKAIGCLFCHRIVDVLRSIDSLLKVEQKFDAFLLYRSLWECALNIGYIATFPSQEKRNALSKAFILDEAKKQLGYIQEVRSKQEQIDLLKLMLNLSSDGEVLDHLNTRAAQLKLKIERLQKNFKSGNGPGWLPYEVNGIKILIKEKEKREALLSIPLIDLPERPKQVVQIAQDIARATDCGWAIASAYTHNEPHVLTAYFVGYDPKESFYIDRSSKQLDVSIANLPLNTACAAIYCYSLTVSSQARLRENPFGVKIYETSISYLF